MAPADGPWRQRVGLRDAGIDASIECRRRCRRRIAVAACTGVTCWAVNAKVSTNAPLSGGTKRRDGRDAPSYANRSDWCRFPQRGHMKCTISIPSARLRIRTAFTDRKSYASPLHSSHTLVRRSRKASVSTSATCRIPCCITPLHRAVQCAQFVGYNCALAGILICGNTRRSTDDPVLL
jgi:hypothetical protein